MNPKPYAVLVNEQKSHRTKAELETRKAAEAAALTGVEMREAPCVKADPAAHKCYARIRKLMKSIGKADAMYEAIVNRYCTLTSEEERLHKERERIEKRQDMLDEWMKNGEIEPDNYAEQAQRLTNQLLAVDKDLQQKRKMLLDIEKECMMTVASALRAIPKKPEKLPKDPMMDILSRRKTGDG